MASLASPILNGILSDAKEAAPDLARGLLRLTPLIISSASLICCWDQRNSMRPFLLVKTDTNTATNTTGTKQPLVARPSLLRTHVQIVLPAWLDAFAKPTLPFILLAYPLACITGLVNALRPLEGVAELHPYARALFAGGAFLSLLHFAFAPADVGLMGKILTAEAVQGRDQGGAGPAERDDALKRLLRLHRWRTALVDFPAWLLYLMATMWMVKGL